MLLVGRQKPVSMQGVVANSKAVFEFLGQFWLGLLPWTTIFMQKMYS
jgi:hypothetical protein